MSLIERTQDWLDVEPILTERIRLDEIIEALKAAANLLAADDAYEADDSIDPGVALDRQDAQEHAREELREALL